MENTGGIKRVNAVSQSKAELGYHTVMRKKMSEDKGKNKEKKEISERGLEDSGGGRVLKMSPSFAGIKLPVIKQVKRVINEVDKNAGNGQRGVLRRSGISMMGLQKKVGVFTEDSKDYRLNRSLFFKQ